MYNMFMLMGVLKKFDEETKNVKLEVEEGEEKKLFQISVPFSSDALKVLRNNIGKPAVFNGCLNKSSKGIVLIAKKIIYF